MKNNISWIKEVDIKQILKKGALKNWVIKSSYWSSNDLKERDLHE